MNIAILLATYNGEKFVQQQIDSILNQDYNDWFLYISDDCSQDETQEILQQYCKKYPKKIKMINCSKHFGNARDNFFFLVEQVEADLYFLADQDDFWMPNKLSISIQYYNKLSLSERGKPLIIHSDLFVVDSNLKLISNSFFKYQNLNPHKNRLGNFIFQNYITGCSMLINRALRDVFLNSSLKKHDHNDILMHDWYFALIASEFGAIKYIPVSLVKYRQHDSNTVGSADIRRPNYIKNRLQNLNTIRYDIERSTQQVSVFLKYFSSELSLKTHQMITDYLTINQKPYITRVLFLIKHGLFKHGLFRIVIQLWFA